MEINYFAPVRLHHVSRRFPDSRAATEHLS
jgi:hypothetical protein